MKRTARQRLWAFAAGALWMAAFWSAQSHAACNAIPVAERWFPSNRGSVDQPIVAPGEVVELRLDPNCAGEKRKFETTNVVRLRFESPRGGLVEVTPLFQVVDDQHLKVTIPDTRSASLGRPNGLAGPARITVNNSLAKPVAEIFRLNQPTSSCDRQPEETFERFTVLPPPNDLSSTSPLLATVDGDNNLLIPVDHTKVVPPAGADPLAVFEYATGLFPHVQGSNKKIAKAIEDALTNGVLPTEFVQVYSLRGQLLPALARFDNKGSLFGTADATYAPLPVSKSVLRFTRLVGGTVLYNVVYMLGGSGVEDGTQPIELKKGSAKPDVQLKACGQTIDLVGLRASSGVVTYTRGPGASGGTIQVHDANRGGQSCGVNTNLTPLRSSSLTVARPQIEVGSRALAFVEKPASPVSPPLRVYDAAGASVGPPSAVPLLGPLLNQRSMVVSDSVVYYVAPPPLTELRAFDLTTHALQSAAQMPIVSAVVSANRAAVLGPTPGVTVYDGTGKAGVSIDPNSAKAIAISPQIVAYTSVPSGAAPSVAGTLMVQTLPVPSLAAPVNVGVTAEAIAAVDSTVVLISAESAEPAGAAGCNATSPAGGCDLNGDGDAADHVLRVYVQGGAGLTEVRLPATDFVATQNYIAFRSPEAEQSNHGILCGAGKPSTCDRNDDGDTNDQVMLVFDRATGTSFSTGQAARRCDSVCTQLGLEWMSPYAIRGTQLFFLSNELEQNQDINGDGSITNLDVLQIFDLSSKKIWGVGAMSAGAGAVTLPLIQSLGDTPPILRLVQQSNPKALNSFVAGDIDDDGTLDAFDTCVASPNPQQADDDCDRLGDRACDPTYCTTFVPRLADGWSQVPELSCKQRDRLERYVNVRAEETRQCLDGFAGGTGAGDPTLACRGYFVNGVQVLPQSPPVDEAVGEATVKLWKAFGAVPGSASHESSENTPSATAEAILARRLVATYGESVNAVSRVAYGSVSDHLTEAQRACQKRIGEVSLEYLTRAVDLMQECLRDDHGKGDPAARCIGSLRDEHVVAPADDDTRCALEKLEAHVRAVASSEVCAQSLPSLDVCGDDPNSAAACLTCVAWRRAAEAVLSLYRPLDETNGTCDVPRLPLRVPQHVTHEPRGEESTEREVR